MPLQNKMVGGKIAHFSLSVWWFDTFTESEREYMDDRFRPMNQRHHSLTKGEYLYIGDHSHRDGDVGLFLNSLATWFRKKDDKSIFLRIRKKIDDIGYIEPRSGVGYVRGCHYVTHVEDVKQLVREKQLEQVEALLLEIIQAIEEEDKKEKLGVAPWYYEELAKIYRKAKEYDKEVWILERFSEQRHGPGGKPKKLLERLDRARSLLEKNNS